VTNGIRQAMAVSLLFFSLIFYHEKKYILFILLSTFSTVLHNSNLLLLPFVFLLNFRFFSLKMSFFAFIFFAFGYVFDFNQYFVRFISDISGFDLYSAIKNYADDGTSVAPWVGFDIRFFSYNVFWFALPFVLWYFKLLKVDKNLIFILKIYSLLCVFYFIFGYGAFSNRWAYPSWLFIPILQAYLLSSLKFSYAKGNLMVILTASTIFFYFSIFFYVSRYF